MLIKIIKLNYFSVKWWRYENPVQFNPVDTEVLNYQKMLGKNEGAGKCEKIAAKTG